MDYTYLNNIIGRNLFYLLTKEFNRNKALKLLIKLKTLVKVLPSDDEVIELSLVSSFKDFKDSIQYYTALIHKLDIQITRNIKDCRDAKIRDFSPVEFIQHMGL